MSAEALFCPKCGHRHPRDARYCGICGAPLAGQVAPSEGGAPPSPGPGLGVNFARGLGELIGETFAVYRKCFWPFVLIALVPNVVALLTPGLIDALLALASGFLYMLASGAAVHAVAQHYLGRPVSVSQCYRRAWHRVLSMAVVTVVIVLALLGSVVLMIVVVGIPLFFFLLVIWFFAVEGIMIEDRRLLAALGRSRELVKGSWWRVFSIGIAFVLIILGLSIGASIPSVILSIAAGILIFPVALIGRTVVYFDLRVRKEGYNLDVLSSEIGSQPGPTPSATLRIDSAKGLARGGPSYALHPARFFSRLRRAQNDIWCKARAARRSVVVEVCGRLQYAGR